MDERIVTASDFLEIDGFDNIEQVDEFFVRYGLKPITPPDGEKYVTVDMLNDASKRPLKTNNSKMKI